MTNYIIFFLYLYILLISIIGYGVFFTKNIYKENKNFSLAIIGLNGFIFVTGISFFTSLFYKHSFTHNIILHFIGIGFFFYYRFWSYKYEELKNFIFLSFFYLAGLLICKTHDDFPYYHLSYTRFLFDNDLYLGMGWLGHGYRTFSSLFFFNSVNILPKINFYSFHFSIFYLILFVNFFYLDRIKYYLKTKASNFLLSYSILAFIYSTNVFYRFAEYGVDRSAQSILFLIIFLFFELILFKEKLNLQNLYKNNLKFIILICSFVASLKALFLIYFLFLLPFLKEILKIDFIKKNLRIIIFSFYFVSFTLLINFFNTGCFLYPAATTCIKKVSWAIPASQVKTMKIHYEWWAKAGGGPNYSSPLKKSDYVKNFKWLKDWLKRHFFNKVSDNLLSTFFICSIFLLNIHYAKNNLRKQNSRLNLKAFLPLYLIIFFEWFLNHPAMRYGGYVLVSLPLILYASWAASKYSYNYKKLKKRIFLLILISLITFNIQNIFRIKKEIKQYSYNLLHSPFFYLPKPKFKTYLVNNKIKIYQTINDMCWATPTPCGQGKYKIINKLKKNIITGVNEQ